jgi:predicted nicotinamide N-methyase
VALPGGGDLVVARPRDAAALLDEERFAAQDEFLPYWADLWPSARALARVLAARRLGGMRVLELGCGLGLPSLVAARGGARACASDWAPEAVAAAQANARRNGLEVEGVVVDWRAPDPLVARAPWDLVIAADVLYEERNVAPLLDLLPRLGADVLLADPGRVAAAGFLAGARERFAVTGTADPGHPSVTVHRLRALTRPRPPASA